VSDESTIRTAYLRAQWPAQLPAFQQTVCAAIHCTDSAALLRAVYTAFVVPKRATVCETIRSAFWESFITPE
jgi:hypothetical protein